MTYLRRSQEMTREEILELNPKDESFADDMMAFLAENVPYEFQMRKALEECFELGEVLSKYLNKAEHNRPDPQRIIEEFGDLTLRIMLLSGHLWGGGDFEKGTDILAEKGFEAIESKLKKMQGWMKEGKMYNLKM